MIDALRGVHIKHTTAVILSIITTSEINTLAINKRIES
jgi:hypothetical protein